MTLHGTPVWPALLAAVLAVLLLLAFERVVRQGMHQGVQRRATQAAQADAAWRCAALRAGPERSGCR